MDSTVDCKAACPLKFDCCVKSPKDGKISSVKRNKKKLKWVAGCEVLISAPLVM
jgi:hypothetical protein